LAQIRLARRTDINARDYSQEDMCIIGKEEEEEAIVKPTLQLSTGAYEVRELEARPHTCRNKACPRPLLTSLLFIKCHLNAVTSGAMTMTPLRRVAVWISAKHISKFGWRVWKIYVLHCLSVNLHDIFNSTARYRRHVRL